MGNNRNTRPASAPKPDAEKVDMSAPVASAETPPAPAETSMETSAPVETPPQTPTEESVLAETPASDQPPLNDTVVPSQEPNLDSADELVADEVAEEVETVRPIYAQGVRYASIEAAARDLLIPMETVYARIVAPGEEYASYRYADEE